MMIHERHDKRRDARPIPAGHGQPHAVGRSLGGSSATRRLTISNFCTLPDAVIGRASMSSSRSGSLCVAIPAEAVDDRSKSSSEPGAGTTQAQTRSPSRSSGSPTTAARGRPRGNPGGILDLPGVMFIPPRMMISFLRPTTVRSRRRPSSRGRRTESSLRSERGGGPLGVGEEPDAGVRAPHEDLARLVPGAAADRRRLARRPRRG